MPFRALSGGPKLDRFQANFGPNLSPGGPTGSPELPQNWPKRPILGPNLSLDGPVGSPGFLKIGRLGQFWAKTTTLATLWATRLSKMGPFWAHFGSKLPPKSAPKEPILVKNPQKRSNFGPFLGQNLGHKCPKGTCGAKKREALFAQKLSPDDYKATRS